MKKSAIYLLALLLACCIFINVSSQQPCWTSVKDTGFSRTPAQKSKSKLPADYKLFRLDAAQLRQQLFSVTGTQRRQSSTIIFLPNASGVVERYAVTESSNFDAALQERFPSIRSFSGRSLDDPDTRLRLTIDPAGIQAMIQRIRDDAPEWIESFSQDPSIYAVFKRQPGTAAGQWRCGTSNNTIVNSLRENAPSINRNGNSGGKLKTIRLGLSCTVEFSQECIRRIAAPITDLEKVMREINWYIAGANVIFERDLAVHVVLVEQSVNAIFIDQDDYDPVIWENRTEDFSGQLQLAAQDKLDEIVRPENYDIGTLFCVSYSASVAKDKSVCINGDKGSSYVTPAYKIDGEFDWTDYYLIIAHEAGHQLGAGHTYSFITEPEDDQQLQQVEPGSGITIMGYPGVSPYLLNINSSCIPYFHGRSIEAIQDHLNTVICPVTTDITAQNAPPVIIQPTDRTIPKSTPFFLTVQANDAPGQALTYSWEQIDAATEPDVWGNSLAYPEKQTGPNWISYTPSVNPLRYFPDITTILEGKYISNNYEGDQGAVCEALSSVGRALKFRVTVRDNVPYSASLLRAGQTAYTDMTVTVDGNSGPFRVTSQNNQECYVSGSFQTVTWSVNGTNGAPVNCANVRILFSDDGGQNFNLVLSDNTANDGEELVRLPSVRTFEGRIKVEAIGNIFFDINDKDFNLLPPVGYGYGNTVPASAACADGAPMSVQLPVISFGGYTGNINLAAIEHNLPDGVAININPNPVPAGSVSTITLTHTQNMPVGNYFVNVKGVQNPAEIDLVRKLEFNITPSAIGPEIIAEPHNRAVCIGNPTSFSCNVAPGLSCTYKWQIKRPPSTIFIDMDAGIYPGVLTHTLEIPDVTEELNACAFRCIVSNFCGADTSQPATLQMSAPLPPSENENPGIFSTCAGGNGFFTAGGGIGLNTNYRWQLKTPGGVFADIPLSGNETAHDRVLALENITASMNNYEYRCRMYNDCGESFVNYQRISVYTILPPQPQNVCPGGFAVFVLGDNSQPEAQYRWQVKTPISDFTDITGNASAVTNRLVLENVSGPMNNNQYRCITRSSTCSSHQSQPVILTVSPIATISVQPASQTICNGGSASFTVIASGNGLSYQWEVKAATANWAAIPNATASILNLPTVTQAMNNNKYRCKISKAWCSSMYSAVATLTVPAAATITSQPQSINSCNGSPVSFSVTATGSNLGYQWQVKVPESGSWLLLGNAYPYTGINTNTLTLTSVPTSWNGRKYRCAVTNQGCSTVYTGEVLLTTDALYFTTHPQNQSACIGGSVVFSATANSTNISYQWELKTPTGSWTAIAGATAGTYSPASVTAGMNGNKYRCRISKAGCNSPASVEATLTVNMPPVIRSSPSSVTACSGGTAIFTVMAEGAGLQYQWEVKTVTQEWSIMTGQTSSTLTLSNLGMGMNNNKYRCKVTLNGCTSTSNIAALEVLGFTSQPVSASPCPGGEARFSVQANGLPQGYRWYFIPDGALPISPVDPVANPSAATRELVLTSVSASQRGYYFCKVTYTSPSCMINSASAGLLVQRAPVIITQPRNQTVCAGNNVQFSIETSGGPNTFRWEAKLPGSSAFIPLTSNANTLEMINLPRAWNGTKIRCVIKNTSCNLSTTSFEVILTVDPVIIRFQPQNYTGACVGGGAYFSMSTNCASGSYQWYVKTPGSSAFTAITGNSWANYYMLSLNNLTRSMHNNKYKCIFTAGNTTYSSNEATLQFADQVSVTINSPDVLTICSGNSVSLSVNSSGPVTGYQWQYAQLSPSGGYLPFADIPSAYSSVLNFSGTNANYLRNGSKFRCKAYGQCGFVNSSTTTVVLTRCELRHLLVQNNAGIQEQYTSPVKDYPVKLTDSNAYHSNVNNMLKTAKDKTTAWHDAISLYPVPNSGTFNIRLNTDNYPAIDLKIYDQSGRLLLSRQAKGLAAGSVIPVTLPHAVNGLYQLRITHSYNPAESAIVKTFMILDGAASIK